MIANNRAYDSPALFSYCAKLNAAMGFGYRTGYRSILALCLALGLLFSAQAQSLGLGNISISSFLGQPLQARIALVSGSENYDIDQLNVGQLNNREASDIGIELAGIYQSFQPRLIEQDGQFFIELRSQKAINEPYLNIVIALRWYDGKLFREYTLLLDPQQFTVDDGAVAPLQDNSLAINTGAVNQGPVLKKTQSLAAPQFNTPIAAATARAVSGGAAVEGLGAGAESYQVQSGDSLSKIAAKLIVKSNTRRGSMMQWLLAQNPSAFVGGDINRLKAGALLVLPGTSQLANTIEPVPGADTVAAEAMASEPQDQSPAAPPEQLTIVSNPKGIIDGSASEYEQLLQAQLASTNEMVERLRRDNQTMRNRLAAIEASKYVASLERLVQLKEDEINVLQQRLDEVPSELAAVAIASPLAPSTENESEQNPKATQRYGLYLLLLLLLSVVGALFFLYRRGSAKKSPAVVAVDANELLRRELDQIIASRSGAPVVAGKNAVTTQVDLGPIGPQKSGFDKSKRREDNVVKQSIQDKTIAYRPPELDLFEDSEHDDLDQRISEAIEAANRGDFNGAQSLLEAERAEQQRFGGAGAADDRLDVATEYVQKLQQKDLI